MCQVQEAANLLSWAIFSVMMHNDLWTWEEEGRTMKKSLMKSMEVSKDANSKRSCT